VDWPKTSSGETDWEAVFEDPNTGLITLVSTAATPAKLRAVTELIVEQLFLRHGDAGNRADYRAELQRIFGAGPQSQSPHSAMDELVAEVASFLRTIKRARIARSGLPRADGAPSETSTTPADKSADTKTSEAIFAAVFSNYVRARFDVITTGLDRILMVSEKPPFILSTAFTDHFIACLDRHFYPRLTFANRGTIARAENQAPEARFAYFQEQMNGQRTRVGFVQNWVEVWKELTQTKKLPPRPVEVKAGPIAKLFGKGSAKPVSVYRMAPEDWEAAADANARAEKIWADIVEDTGVYLCPTDDDKRLLMNMLGRTPDNLQRQIASIAQIVVQGGSRQTFDAYQYGRDIDLALLVACYRHPAPMLGSEGFVTKMLGDHPDAFRRERYPLVSRFIFDRRKAVTTTAQEK